MSHAILNVQDLNTHNQNKLTGTGVQTFTWCVIYLPLEDRDKEGMQYLLHFVGSICYLNLLH
jgi:hypothetical protein